MSLRSRRLVPGALAVTVMRCSAGPTPGDAGQDAGHDAGRDAGQTDAGLDAGYDAGTSDAGEPCATATSPTDDAGNADAGTRCGCIVGGQKPDGGLDFFFYCDNDPFSPCALGCYSPKLADGGRVPDGDGGAQCLC